MILILLTMMMKQGRYDGVGFQKRLRLEMWSSYTFCKLRALLFIIIIVIVFLALTFDKEDGQNGKDDDGVGDGGRDW